MSQWVKSGAQLVLDDGADIGRMRGLDGEAPRLAGLQLEIDVVLLGAERRLAGVDHVDRQRVGGVRGRRAEQQQAPASAHGRSA